jgi:hypothetical protein
MFGQSIGMQTLDRVDNIGVQHLPPFRKQAAISDIVGQSMLEGLLRIRE